MMPLFSEFRFLIVLRERRRRRRRRRRSKRGKQCSLK